MASIENWGFADGQGNEITRGWQGYSDQAKRKAQELANQRNDVVEYWVEGAGDDAEEERPSFSCEPEDHFARLKALSDNALYSHEEVLDAVAEALEAGQITRAQSEHFDRLVEDATESESRVGA